MNNLENLPWEDDNGKLYILEEIAKQASANAIKESKALNLSIVYMEDKKIIKEYPNGEKEIM